MTYFGFLLVFLWMPLAILATITMVDLRRNPAAPGAISSRALAIGIGIHVLLALAYTTPWDNYLVASGVWHYDPQKVAGIVIGWVPLEEYLFFILETVMAGLWWRLIVRRIPDYRQLHPSARIRWLAAGAVFFLWIGSLALLVSRWQPGDYLALILAWALPPILLQLAFGADVLWYFRRRLAAAILPVWIFLCAADAVAIASGTWTINPARITRILIGPLPVEEALFFLVTLELIGFGLTLALLPEGQARLMKFLRRTTLTNPKEANSSPSTGK